jgi:hypothetical protein
MSGPSGMIMSANVCGGRRIIQHGFDVTDNVQLRMTKNGVILDSEQTQGAVVRNALASLRKEAIWQYYIRRVPGFLFWTIDQSVAYVPRLHSASASRRPSLPFIAHLKKLVDTYQPDAEAIVWSEHDCGDELFKISVEDSREYVLFVSAPLLATAE